MPTVDIEVLFGYDSTEITPEAAAGLKTLGEALADQRLAGQRFVIAGHTDARGRRDYNDYLSDRRAQAVRRYLIRQYRVPPGALIARGFGESRLKNPANPEGPENRRVQIINWSQPKAVSRRR